MTMPSLCVVILKLVVKTDKQWHKFRQAENGDLYMFHGKIEDFVLRKESVSFEDGTSLLTESIFITTKVKDFEQYNDEEVPATIIIVKGSNIEYSQVMTPDTECIGGVYMVSAGIDKTYVFDIFTDESEFEQIYEKLKLSCNNPDSHFQIYVDLHRYCDFTKDVVLPITSFSLSHGNNDSDYILMGIIP